MIHQGSGRATSTSSAKAKPAVIRGFQSWSFIYIVMGLLITIEGTVITMIEPLKFPWNILVFSALAAFTVLVCIKSTWFHERLFRVEQSYEDTPET